MFSEYTCIENKSRNTAVVQQNLISDVATHTPTQNHIGFPLIEKEFLCGCTNQNPYTSIFTRFLQRRRLAFNKKILGAVTKDVVCCTTLNVVSTRISFDALFIILL